MQHLISHLFSALLKMFMWLGTTVHAVEETMPVPYRPHPVSQSNSSYTAEIAMQMLHVLLALGVVVGLIYVLGKWAVPKFIGLPVRAIPRMRVIERAQLDQKNAAVIIEITGEGQFLVATNEHGTRLLAQLKSEQPSQEHIAETIAEMQGPTL